MRRSEPLGQVATINSWHLNVGDDDVGTVGAGLPNKVLGVASHSDHFKPSLLEHTHDALSDQRLVLTDHHPDRRRLSHGPTLSAAWGYPKPRSEGCPMGNAAVQT